MKIRAFVIVAAAALALSACAPADTSPGGVAAKARHEHFETLGKTFKGLMDEGKKPAPDAAKMTAAAAEIDALAQDLPNWFPAGSGPADGVKTHAKAEVWTQADAFAEKAKGLRDEAAALKAASAEGVVAMQPHVAALGGKCKDCHDQFKAK
jgi:cytochrome c556